MTGLSVGTMFAWLGPISWQQVEVARSGCGLSDSRSRAPRRDHVSAARARATPPGKP